MESIKYGVQKPKGDFDRRGVQNNAGSDPSYLKGKQEQSNGGKVYATGDRMNNPKGSANFATQVKGQGITGTGSGHGQSNFTAKGKSSAIKSGSAGSQDKGFGGQKRGK